MSSGYRGRRGEADHDGGVASEDGELAPGRRTLTSRLRPPAGAIDGRPDFLPPPVPVAEQPRWREKFGLEFDEAGRVRDDAAVPHQARMEEAFGEDFSSVRSHLGAGAEMDALGAHAVAHGEDISFASSSPDPRLVAHELTHVVQQRRGGATAQAKPIEQGARDSLEREADDVGDRVAAGQPAGEIRGVATARGLRDPDPNAKDVLPSDQFVLVEGDRFKLHFRRGAESRFYVDITYQGPFDVTGSLAMKDKTAPLSSDVPDRDRKFNARILKVTDTSVVVDVYGDGIEVVTIADHVSPTANERVHVFTINNPRSMGMVNSTRFAIQLPAADGTGTPAGASVDQLKREAVSSSSFKAIDNFKLTARRFGDSNKVAVHLELEGGIGFAYNDWTVPVEGNLDNVTIKILRNDGRNIEIDFNGDGKADLKIVHTVELEPDYAGKQIRKHHLRHFDKDGVSLDELPEGTVGKIAGAPVTIPGNQDETKNKPDVGKEWPVGREPGQSDVPGQVPEPIKRPGDIIEIRLDGDGDRTAELLMRIKGEATATNGTIRIELVQLSSIGATKTWQSSTFTTTADNINRIKPWVVEVANGHDPCRVDIIPSDAFGKTQSLKLFPPTKDAVAKTRTYRVEFLGAGVTYTFPEETEPANPLVKATKAAANIGNIARFDTILGEYGDRFWIMHEPVAGGREVLTIASVNDDGPATVFGTQIVDPARIKSFTQVNAGPLSFGIDLDADGKADIQVFDALSGPLGMLTKPPLTSDRDHVLTVSGSMIGGDQKWTYQVRGGKFTKLMLSDWTGATTNRDASAAAAAVNELEQQVSESTSTDASGAKKPGDVGALLTRIAGALTANRLKAKNDGLIGETLYAAWKDLSDKLTELGPQISKSNPTKTVDAKLQTDTAAAARKFIDELTKESSADPNRIEETPETRGGAAWTYKTNKYTGETTTDYGNGPSLGPRRGPNMELAGDIEKGKWPEAKNAFDQLSTGLDRWVLYRAKQLKKTDFANQQEYLLGQQKAMGEIQGKDKLVRVAAVFQPDASYNTNTKQWQEVPLMLFAYQEGGSWYLKDISNPQREPFLDHVDVAAGETMPPMRLFEKLDYRRHFPKGVIHFQVPGGVGGEIVTTASKSWSDWLQWIGLGLAVIGFSIATFGTGAVAATAAAVAFAASGIATAAGAIIDLKERAEHGDLEPTAVLMDIAMIASGIASGVAAISGRIVSAAAAADTAAAQGVKGAAAWSGAAARIAQVAQKAYVPAIGVAAVADTVNVLAMGAETIDAIRRINSGPGSTGDKATAIAGVLAQAFALGGIAVLSIKGTMPEIMSGKPTIVIDVMEGIPIARAAGSESGGVKLNMKGGADAQSAGRWQSHGLDDAAANPKDPKHGVAKALADDSEFMKYYRQWMEQAEPKVKFGADGRPQLNYHGPEKPPKAIEEKLQQVAEGGGIALYEKAFGNAAEIRRVEEAIAKKGGKVDLQPGTPGWNANRAELVKALGADGEALVARYERMRLGPAAADPAAFLAQREQLRRVVPDAEVDRVARVFPEYEVYITGSATQPGKQLAKNMDVDVVVVVPKDTPPELIAAIEQRARGLEVRPDPQYLHDVVMGTNEKLRVDVKVMTPEQFMGFTTSSAGGGGHSPMNFTRVDKPIDAALQTKLNVGVPDPKMNAAATRVDMFRTKNNNTIGFKQGSKTTVVDGIELELSNGTRRKFNISEYDANHYQQGHTVEQYSFEPANINRAANSTFWPPGTSTATQQLHAKMAVQQLRGEIEAAIKAGGNPNFITKSVEVNGISYKVGVELSTNRITQFYPQSGPGIVPVHKTELMTMKTTLGK